VTVTANKLRDDALAIWRAGLEAVRSDRLVREWVRVEGNDLLIGEERLSLDRIRRIAVVGAGKAGAGMAAGLEEALGDFILDQKQVAGWINVPEDCVRPLRRIHLHGARPAGLNEPTEAGVQGTEEILRLVGSLNEHDLCLCLISGGGSALLPAPAEGITLADKQAVTRHLSAAGANIKELNTVRKRLSRIKGGGLARACRAGTLISLIISDVLGDQLDMIASGPTVEDPASPDAALEVLERFTARAAGVSERVFQALRHPAAEARSELPASAAPRVVNLVIGNNAVAVDSAGIEAERRGYSHAMSCATQPEGAAEEIGRHLARMAVRMRSEAGPDCLITGGEPTVRLVPASQRGLGGRNQQLVLAALEELAKDERSDEDNPLHDVAILSGGADGEDGPTDAAGAVIDSDLWASAREQRLDPAAYLRRNDAYHFFEPIGGLIKTGPTHTNVCDVRVVVVKRTNRVTN
jgi:hydroxypyruvate reductase